MDDDDTRYRLLLLIETEYDEKYLSNLLCFSEQLLAVQRVQAALRDHPLATVT